MKIFGDLLVRRDLSVERNAFITGTMAVTSTSTLSGAVTMGSNMSVAGLSTLTGAVHALNDMVVGGVSTLTGAVSMGSNMSVSGLSTLTGAVHALNDMVVSGVATITGAASFGSNVSVTGVATITGAAHMLNDMVVNGVSTLTGAVSMGSNLSVTGVSTLTGAVNALSNLTVGGVATITGAATFSDNVTIAGIAVADRMNEGMTVEALAGTKSIAYTDNAYQVYDPDGADRDVILPDATSSNMPLGWKIVIANSGSANSLVVKDNGGSALKTITAPAPSDDSKIYAFVLAGKSSAAGLWLIEELGDTTGASTHKYAASVALAADGDYFTGTLTQATHQCGVNPIVTVFELNGSDYDMIMLDNLKIMGATGNIVLQSTVNFTPYVKIV